MPVLFEKMLKTSVEEPERFRDIGYVLKMVTDKEIIPDEFRELYDTFCNTLKIFQTVQGAFFNIIYIKLWHKITSNLFIF